MEIRIQLIVDNDEQTRRDIAHWERKAWRPIPSDSRSTRRGPFYRLARMPSWALR